MLRSDLSRRAHPNFLNYFFVHNVFFQHIDVKSTSLPRKLEVHIESKFHFSVSIDVLNHFNATNIKNKIINPSTYKLFDASEKTVPHFVTSL